ncbi:MAG: hypothetical protein VKJ64_03415 [Leptolyngbyaceae bacterium]|nr:hypothetical protein [Leptolyngbyaceae bacterium]
MRSPWVPDPGSDAELIGGGFQVVLDLNEGVGDRHQSVNPPP